MLDSRKVLLGCLLVSLIHGLSTQRGKRSIFDIIPAGTGLVGGARSTSSMEYKKSSVFSHFDELKNNLKKNMRKMKMQIKQIFKTKYTNRPNNQSLDDLQNKIRVYIKNFSVDK